MAQDKREFKELIIDNKPLEFCRRHLFDQDIYLFEKADALGIKGSYLELKVEISNTLGTSPDNVAIVGSGKFGFSMNPTKKELLKCFNSHSDVDIVIACPKVFESIWKSLRQSYYSNHIDVRDKHSADIFSKFLVVNNKIEYRSKHMRDIVTLLEEMKKNITRKFRIKRTINYRIYSNWSDVEDYHEFGINLLQNALSGPRGEKI
tara:strand:- start:17773 stop:18387 length:615 start_codon:yes stop_codon:yes gene_type:complete